jgi:hypothetical protein
VIIPYTDMDPRFFSNILEDDIRSDRVKSVAAVPGIVVS